VRAVAEGFFGPLENVPDDARQFMFWMQRWFDPALFQHDVIADYFESVAPVGYVAVFRAFAAFGIEPLTTSKLLAVPVTLAVAFYAFRLAHRLLPIPAVAFFAAWLCVFAQWWSNSNLGSGTPRTFYAPLLLAFADALVARSRLGVMASVGLLGLFYPQMAIFAAGVVCLDAVAWTSRGPRLRRDAVVTAAATVAVFFAAVLPFASQSGEFGPTVTLAEARQEPTFQDGERPFRGRTPIFSAEASAWELYVIDGRLGFLPGDWRTPFLRGRLPAFDRAWEVFMLALVVALPVVLVRRARRGGPDAPTPDVRIFGDVVAAAAILYFVALAVLFRLHLPSRYSTNPLNLYLPIALVLALAPALLAGARRIAPPAKVGRGALGRLVLLAAIVGAVASIGAGRVRGLVEIESGEIFARLAEQPADAMIATLSIEASNVPVLAKRSTLVTREHTVPYSRGYFLEMKHRLTLLARAVHALDPEALATLIDDYGVDVVVVHESEIGHPDADWWAGVIPDVARELARDRPTADAKRALAPILERCGSRVPGGYFVVEADCMSSAIAPAAAPQSAAAGSRSSAT